MLEFVAVAVLVVFVMAWLGTLHIKPQPKDNDE